MSCITHQFVSEATWGGLRKAFFEKQCMDVVFTGAQYTLVVDDPELVRRAARFRICRSIPN